MLANNQTTRPTSMNRTTLNEKKKENKKGKLTSPKDYPIPINPVLARVAVRKDKVGVLQGACFMDVVD